MLTASNFRRPIEPPPILSIIVDRGTEDILTVEAPFLVAKASLIRDFTPVGNPNYIDEPFNAAGEPLAVNPLMYSPPFLEYGTSDPYIQAEILKYHQPVDILIGGLVVPSQPFRDVDNQRRQFFVFNDLSVRISGSYRLVVQLFRVQ